ncbi:hypothetical protein JCM8547_003686 [Rhodosporidiobolus lusitaniae]
MPADHSPPAASYQQQQQQHPHPRPGVPLASFSSQPSYLPPQGSTLASYSTPSSSSLHLGRPSSSSSQAMHDPGAFPHHFAGSVPFAPSLSQQSSPAQPQHPMGLPLPSMQSMSPTQSEHVWRDEGRRKSLRLDSGALNSASQRSATQPGNGVGGEWEYTALAHEASRRASWAGQANPASYPHATLDSRPGSQGGPSTATTSAQAAYVNGYGVSPAWSSHFPSTYTPTMPSTSEDPQPPASGYAAALPQPPAYYPPHPAYLSNSAAGAATTGLGYAPYTPASSTFPSSAYALPSTSGVFATPYSMSGSPQTSVNGAAYLPTPRTVYAPTPTVPPHATLASYAPVSPVSPSFPLDASTPYIPSTSTTPPQVVLTAAATRQKLSPIDLTGHSKPDPTPRRPVGVAASTRRAVELAYDCQNCQRKIGTLTLRGGAVEKSSGDHASKYIGIFTCTSCGILPPASAGSGGGTPASYPANTYAGEASYYDTLTAAVDVHLGLDPKTADTRPSPAPPGKTRSGFTPTSQMGPGAKKRRSSVVDSNEGILGCDVCRRDLGAGSLAVAATGEAVGATIEVLCAHCETRYVRCSDCGGGGGQKGVGRWRSKEVFTNGRKTCMLSHTRLGTVNEMDYDVYTIASLKRNDVSELIEHCRDLYYTTLLGTLAVPDMIESACPIARNYHEVEKLCVDSWTTYEPLMTTDIEPTSNIRRYIALRWVRPATRKKRSKKTNSTGSPDLNGQGSPENNGNALLPPVATSNGNSLTDSPKQTAGGNRPVIREGKMLTGFILAEHDLDSGYLHVALTLPTGAGEAYEASTRLLQTLIARVHEDLAATNVHRQQASMPLYPVVTMAWTMHMTKRDSRIMSRLETRRGFIPLEDYLVKHTETNRMNFPPHRPTYLPPELLRGWSVYAKRLTRDDLPPGTAALVNTVVPAALPAALPLPAPPVQQQQQQRPATSTGATRYEVPTTQEPLAGTSRRASIR